MESPNGAIVTPPTTNGRIGVTHPYCPANRKPTMMAPTLRNERTVPPQSNTASSCVSVSRTVNNSRNAASRPTLSRPMANRHVATVARNPISNGPTACADAVTAPHTPNAVARRFPS